MKYLRRFAKSLLRINPKTVYLYSVVVGTIAGFGALAFFYSLQATTHFTYEWLAHIPIPHPGGEHPFFEPIAGEPRRWLFFWMPALGGLLAGWIVYKFAPESEGTGTEGFLDAFHNKAGQVQARVPFFKSIATIMTLSSGGSAGKEGPVAQIGSGIGSVLGKWLKVGARARRTLLLAGAAGGLGAIFRAPLGGALTAIEVLYKEDFETDALIPCVISSVMAYTIFCSFMGFNHIFNIEVTASYRPIQLLCYLVLGLVCSGIGFFYCHFFHGIKNRFFDRLPIPKYLVPAVGGLLVGCIGFFYPEVTGASLGFIQQVMDGSLGKDWVVASRMFILFAVLKIIATSFTISSGGSGGVFGPSLFIGGMLGGMVGTVSHHFFPEWVPQVAPFVVVGMASFFAGVANAPIASIVMVSELTGGYELLPPLMIVAVISLIFSKRFSIYKNQVQNKFFSKAHLWDMNPNILQRVRVADAFQGHYHRKAIINEKESYAHVKLMAADLQETDFAVQNEEKALVGIFSLKDIYFDKNRTPERERELTLKELTRKNISYVTPQDNLFRALERLLESESDKIPVVDKQGEQKRLLGYLLQRDILSYYQQSFSTKALMSC